LRLRAAILHDNSPTGWLSLMNELNRDVSGSSSIGTLQYTPKPPVPSDSPEQEPHPEPFTDRNRLPARTKLPLTRKHVQDSTFPLNIRFESEAGVDIWARD
jgi:hypothetical protein